MSTHVVLRCDGSRTMGVGHVARSLAIGQELVARGARVTLLGRVAGIPWLEQELSESGILVVPAESAAESLAAQALGLGADAVVLDGYDLDPASGAALRGVGITVLALVDGPFGAAQEADCYLDQNLGAAPDPSRGAALQLAGLDFTLFRDAVLRHRRPAGHQPARSDPRLRVLAVFGGTDPYAASPVAVPLLASTGRPMHVVAIAAHADLRSRLEETTWSRGQSLEILAPTPDLPAIAASCDVALTAAGSSVWELLCLGVPTAVLCVVDNQRVGYDAVMAAGVAVGIGSLAQLKESARARRSAATVLDGLLGDPARRAELARSGAALVDGAGRARVADVLLRLVDERRVS